VMFQRFAGDGDALSAPEFQILENSSHTMAGRSRSESPWLCDSPSLSEHQSRLDANPLYNVVVSRKRAEQDSILLANRIRLLRAEEEKTRKKTKETEKKTQEILELRRRSEERRVAKEAEDARREAEERELRSRQMQEREEQNRKLSERQRSILEQKTDMSSAVRSEREANMQAVEEQRLMEAADVMAKAEKVRATAQAAARSRARSEGAKHELAQGIVQERMVREDDIRRTKALEIERMESEEAQLISRLQQSQERHRAAYLRLENALQHNGGGSVPASHPGTPGARSAKGLSCGTSVSSRALAVGATGVAAAVSSLGSGGGSSSSSCSAGGGGRGYRPPRPGGPPSSLILHFVGSAAAMPQHHQQHQQQQQQQQQRRAPMARTVSAAGLGVRFEQQQQQQHQQQRSGYPSEHEARGASHQAREPQAQAQSQPQQQPRLVYEHEGDFRGGGSPPAPSGTNRSGGGSIWEGPPAPVRAENRSMQRGSQALPEGCMEIRGTTQGDLFQDVQRDKYARPERHFNRSLARGTLALPDGKMRFEGTTGAEFGNMYRLKSTNES